MRIRIILVSIGLNLTTFLNLNAQNIKFGVSGGLDVVNIHQIHRDPKQIGSLFCNRMSFNVNCLISYKSQSIWGFSVEPGFIQKGASGNIPEKPKIKYNFLQMPILLDVYFLDKFYFSFGPEIAHMLNAKAVFTDHKDDMSSIFDDKFEISGLLGIHYTLSKRVDIGLRYNHGIKSLLKVPFYGDTFEVLGYSKFYTSYFQLMTVFKI